MPVNSPQPIAEFTATKNPSIAPAARFNEHTNSRLSSISSLSSDSSEHSVSKPTTTPAKPFSTVPIPAYNSTNSKSPSVGALTVDTTISTKPPSTASTPNHTQMNSKPSPAAPASNFIPMNSRLPPTGPIPQNLSNSSSIGPTPPPPAPALPPSRTTVITTTPPVITQLPPTGLKTSSIPSTPISSGPIPVLENELAHRRVLSPRSQIVASSASVLESTDTSSSSGSVSPENFPNNSQPISKVALIQSNIFCFIYILDSFINITGS